MFDKIEKLIKKEIFLKGNWSKYFKVKIIIIIVFYLNIVNDVFNVCWQSWQLKIDYYKKEKILINFCIQIKIMLQCWGYIRENFYK